MARAAKTRGTRSAGPLRSVGRSVGRLGSKLGSVVTQRFTVMFIPHSEKRIVNFQINSLLLGFLCALLIAMIAGFFYMSTVFAGSSELISDTSESLEDAQASLDGLREEIQATMESANVFMPALQRAIAQITGSEEIEAGNEPAGIGDLASFTNVEPVAPGELAEIQDLRQLSAWLEAAVRPLEDIGGAFELQEELLRDIPNLWPVKWGLGRVTMEWGPNIHPVNGQWYLHKGIDIAHPSGVPIVASADGKVVKVGIDPLGFGKYIEIDHRYGFRTRYSHLRDFLVDAGDEVRQGQDIGLMGSTGLSTGPHLDFQLYIGSEVVDPATFLKISRDFDRQPVSLYRNQR